MRTNQRMNPGYLPGQRLVAGALAWAIGLALSTAALAGSTGDEGVNAAGGPQAAARISPHVLAAQRRAAAGQTSHAAYGMQTRMQRQAAKRQLAGSRSK